MSLVAVLGFMAIIATYWGVRRFRAWAEQRQIIDMPNERSSHTRPTPRGGGLIIVGVTLFFGAILAATLVPDSIWHVYLPFAAGAILVAAISWLDDLRSLSNSARLAAHLSGAVIVIAGLGYWRTLALPFFGTITLGWWGALITALWIVGLTTPTTSWTVQMESPAGRQSSVGWDGHFSAGRRANRWFPGLDSWLPAAA